MGPEGRAHDAVDDEVDGTVEGVEVAHQGCHHHYPEWRPAKVKKMYRILAWDRVISLSTKSLFYKHIFI